MYFSGNRVDSNSENATELHVQQSSDCVAFKIAGMEEAISKNLNDIRNIVDVTDGFLMKAYEQYFVEANKPIEVEEKREPTLFERYKQILSRKIALN